MQEQDIKGNLGDLKLYPKKEILSSIHNLKGKIQKMYIQIKIKTVPYKLYNKCDIKTQNKNNKVYFY